jgi:alkylation response protein AidB-like acyl-CoA dehydrogenase
MEFSLDDEQRLIVSTVRRFADKELREWAADADREGSAPDRLADVAGEVGFFLDAVPADADGLLEGPYGHTTRALRSIELGRGCAALAAILESNVEPALAVGAWGSDQAKSEVFGAMGEGKLATTANDARGALEITAGESGLSVTGKLGPLPCAAEASHILVCAHAGDDPVLFLLPTASATVEALVPSGWRAAKWATVTCDGASVPGDLVLRAGGDAAETIAEVLSWYRVGLAARAVGVSIAAMEHATQYGTERVQFGKPIGTFESLARLLDVNETRTAAARAYVLQAAWSLDSATSDAADIASRARDFAADVVGQATIDAVQIYGGYGFVNDYPVEKLMRDARAFEVLLGNESFQRVLARTASPQGVRI